jgi:hypothetical protein
MGQRGKGTARNLDAQPSRIEGERLKPIRKVMRELERPDLSALQAQRSEQGQELSGRASVVDEFSKGWGVVCPAQ